MSNSTRSPHIRNLIFVICLYLLTLSISRVNALDYDKSIRKLSFSLNDVYRKIRSLTLGSFRNVFSRLVNLTESQNGPRKSLSGNVESAPVRSRELSIKHRDILFKISRNLVSTHNLLKTRFQKFSNSASLTKRLGSSHRLMRQLFTDSSRSTSVQTPRCVSTFAAKVQNPSTNFHSPISSPTGYESSTNVLSNMKVSMPHYVLTPQHSNPPLARSHKKASYNKYINDSSSMSSIFMIYKFIQGYTLTLIIDEVIKFYRQSLSHFRLIVCWMFILSVLMVFIMRVSSAKRVARAIKDEANSEPLQVGNIPLSSTENERSAHRDDVRQSIASFMTKSIERAFVQQRMAAAEIYEAGTHCSSKALPAFADLDRRIYQLVNMMADDVDREPDQKLGDQTAHRVHFRPTEEQRHNFVAESEVSQNLEFTFPSDDENNGEVIHASAGRTPVSTRHGHRTEKETLSDEYDDETIRSSAGRTPAPSKRRADNVSEGPLMMTLRNGKSTPVRRNKKSTETSSQEGSSSAKRRVRGKL